MSHSIVVTLIADQEIFLCGVKINVHDIESVKLDGMGRIVSFYLKDKTSDRVTLAFQKLAETVEKLDHALS